MPRPLDTNRPNHITHHNLYLRWNQMRQRCENPKQKDYPNYGGRGIQVCERWRKSFADFAEDVGMPPAPSYQLDRVDNDRGYEPGNVRWATRSQQHRNKRSSINIEINGVTRSLKEWCEQPDAVAYKTAFKRLKEGKSNYDAVFKPPDNRGGNQRQPL